MASSPDILLCKEWHRMQLRSIRFLPRYVRIAFPKLILSGSWEKLTVEY
jgi:hypothetical protein